MSSIGKVTAKRTYSRVQEGPWASLSAMPEMYDYDVKLKKPRLGPTSATKPSVHPKICLSWLPPAPEEGYPIADPQPGMPGFRFRVSPSSPSQAAKTRSTSEPPSGLTVSPKRTGVAPSSLVETIAPARQPFNRRASVPYLSALPWPAPLAKEPTSPTTLPPLPLIHQDSISTTSTYFSNPPSLESDSIIGSTPASPTTSNSLSLSSDNQFIASTQQLIEFAKRTSLGGRHGEWSTEKKEILCAYFLGNSFPNMRQREGLGRQVGLEVSQSARFVYLFVGETHGYMRYRRYRCPNSFRGLGRRLNTLGRR
ncbi:hypothetical protein BDV93DRAFT_141716 [Ceratobasidium sp. AG-I]|nr:hypothetical protein BDV93DRAFT_141716 [Ceratobasidium sp. AG-I]